MSASDLHVRLHIEGEPAEDLSVSYDEEADILYTWRGDEPREAVSISSVDGHLIRLDPMTHELVGVTIFDWNRRWRTRGTIELRTPTVDAPSGGARSARRDFVTSLIPA